jgi:4-hydroxyphenylacetate 3-monooxygenase
VLGDEDLVERDQSIGFVAEAGELPVIRQRVAQIVEYSVVLRGVQLGAIERAAETDGGLMVPNVNLLTAGRSYGLQQYANILQTIQDLAGQGIIMRFTGDQLEQPAAFGKPLSWFLDAPNVSAEEKNLVMNLAWDVTSTSHSGRVHAFEHQNSLNVPILRERLYGEVDRSAFVDDCRHFIGLGQQARRTGKGPDSKGLTTIPEGFAKE